MPQVLVAYVQNATNGRRNGRPTWKQSYDRYVRVLWLAVDDPVQ